MTKRDPLAAGQASLDPEGLVRFQAGGRSFTAFFGFRAMKEVERAFDLPFFQALQAAMPALAPEDADDPDKVREAGASIRMTHIGTLLQAALTKHHPDLDETGVEELVDEIGIRQAGEAIAEAVAAALAKQGGGEGEGNPPAARRNGRTG